MQIFYKYVEASGERTLGVAYPVPGYIDHQKSILRHGGRQPQAFVHRTLLHVIGYEKNIATHFTKMFHTVSARATLFTAHLKPWLAVRRLLLALSYGYRCDTFYCRFKAPGIEQIRRNLKNIMWGSLRDPQLSLR